MNLLLQDAEINGTLNFNGEFTLHGKLEGEIVSNGALTLGETALVVGDIKVGSAVIFGKVLGTITTQDRCELKSTAVVEGDVTAGVFSLEEGASFIGRSQVGKRTTGAVKK